MLNRAMRMIETQHVYKSAMHIFMAILFILIIVSCELQNNALPVTVNNCE